MKTTGRFSTTRTTRTSSPSPARALGGVRARARCPPSAAPQRLRLPHPRQHSRLSHRRLPPFAARAVTPAPPPFAVCRTRLPRRNAICLPHRRPRPRQRPLCPLAARAAPTPPPSAARVVPTPPPSATRAATPASIAPSAAPAPVAVCRPRRLLSPPAPVSSTEMRSRHTPDTYLS